MTLRATCVLLASVFALLSPRALARWEQCVDTPPACSTHPGSAAAFCAPWDEMARSVGQYVDSSCHPCTSGTACTGTSSQGSTYTEHGGLDIPWARTDDPVLAAAGGVVVCVLREDDTWWASQYTSVGVTASATDLAPAADRRPFTDDRGYGNHVVIRSDLPDGSTFYTVYGHLSNILVEPGDCATQGERIAEGVSLTGNTTGPHLHLEVRRGSNDSCHAFEPYSVPLWNASSPVCSEAPTSAFRCSMRSIEPTPDRHRALRLAPAETFLYRFGLSNRGIVPWDSAVVDFPFRATRLRVRVQAEPGTPLADMLPELATGADGALEITNPSPTPFNAVKRFEVRVHAPTTPGLYRVDLVAEISITDTSGTMHPFTPIGGDTPECVAPIFIEVLPPPDPSAPPPDLCRITVASGETIAAPEGACVQLPAAETSIADYAWGACSWVQCRRSDPWLWYYRGASTSDLDAGEREDCTSVMPATGVETCRQPAGADLYRTCDACAAAAAAGWPVAWSRASRSCVWCGSGAGGADAGTSDRACESPTRCDACEPSGTLVPGDPSLGHGGNLTPSADAGICAIDGDCCGGGHCLDGRCIVPIELAGCLAREALCDETRPCCGAALCTASPGIAVRRCRGLADSECRSSAECAGGMQCDATATCEAGQTGDACVAAIDPASTGSLSGLFAASSFECVPGLLCVTASSAGTATPVCREPCDFLAAQSACDASEVCQEVAPGAIGVCRPCGGGAPCTPLCGAGGSCPPDLRCAPTAAGPSLCVARCGQGYDPCPEGLACRPGGVCMPCEGALCLDAQRNTYCAGDGAHICGYAVRTHFQGTLSGWIYCNTADPGQGARQTIPCTCDNSADLDTAGSCFSRAIVSYGSGYEGAAMCQGPGTCEAARTCMPRGGRCGHYSECCDGLDCGMDGLCACRPAGDRCSSDAVCCGGVCTPDGFCGCRSEGGLCERSADCCAGLSCLGGACRTAVGCELFASPCAAQTECCYPLRCRDATWGGAAECCLAAAVQCERSTDCCGAMECVGGVCACRPAGASCANGFDCCTGLSCVAGTCQ